MDADAAGTLVLRSPLPGEYDGVSECHGALYAREYGFDALQERGLCKNGVWHATLRA